MTETELLKLKKKVEDAKTSASELTGQKTILNKQLKENWKCNSIEEAEKKLSSKSKEIDDIDEKIEAGITELTEKYKLEKD